MQTRPLGKTGMNASVIGLGLEHIDEKPFEVVDETISAAIDNGVTILDVFMPGEEVRLHVGRSLAGRRDKVILQGHIGSVDLNQQYDISRDLEVCKRYFENLLKCLRTDYIDIGMLFFMDSHEHIDAALNNGIVDYARKLKRDGVIRAIGASAHNPETAKRVVEEGIAEVVMFSLNPAFDMMPETRDIAVMLENKFDSLVSVADPARAEFYRLCESRGVGITVMKPLGAGKLLSPEHTPFAKPLTVGQCIHYALTRPAVVSAMVGCKSRKEVEEAVGYLSLSEQEKDFSDAISRFREDARGGFSGVCVYCNHCLPCPASIDIASVHKYLDIARLNEAAVPPSVAQHYRDLRAHGSDCVSCGSCEGRCPFGVSIMEDMQRAAALFGV
ncbi:MAG: aldo/keto reductase [Planctomycetota bacterium]|jgi:predicted aldo/keto reductase-like oxidoreductase|nr:aldo/keto reductase [Planctomycetota bacterium]